MKIAWYTPLARESSIARVSRLVVSELARHADVHLWRPEEPAAAGCDLAVYNLGNHIGYHREIFEASRRAPGIVILHDYVMRNFFAAYWRRDVPGDRPLFEEAVRGAWGVVVHSGFLRRRVARVFPGPVKKLGLPLIPDRSGPLLSRAQLGIPKDTTLVLTIGHVNPNKRIEAVIEALKRHRGVTYVVAGPFEEAYRRTFGECAARFTGYVTDVELRSYLEHADLCVNLRDPVTEGASGSVIEEMLYGKPVIVTDNGFFSELPDDCVRKVNPRHEREDLAKALGDLLADRGARRALGARAQRYAAAEFRVDAYAKGILEMARELLYAKPLLRYADRVGDILFEMGVSAEMPVAGTVARVSAELFSPREPCEPHGSPSAPRAPGSNSPTRP